MKPREGILIKVRNLWLFEYCFNRVLFIAAIALNALLTFLVLRQAFKFPFFWVFLVPLGFLIAAGVVYYRGTKRIPDVLELFKLLDERAGTGDLFSSAFEFEKDLKRYGWLGTLTSSLASAALEKVQVKNRYALARVDRWRFLGKVSGVVFILYAVTLIFTSSDSRLSVKELTAIKKVTSQTSGPVKSAASAAQKEEKPKEEARKPITKEQAEEFKEIKPEKAEKEAVKITNEMVDKLMDQVTEKQEIDMEGVTPIRWDKDELSGEKNSQNKEEEKINPVKLDAQLLKDLQASKKEKAKDQAAAGKGTDIAVMGEEASGDKAKGTKGGKDDKGTLAGAVSKDPRGTASRMAKSPDKTGFEIISAGRAVTRQPGRDQQMQLPEFALAARMTKSKLAEITDKAAPDAQVKSSDGVLNQEPLPDSLLGVVKGYFERLRKEEK